MFRSSQYIIYINARFLASLKCIPFLYRLPKTKCICYFLSGPTADLKESGRGI
jgi:hypothetical protein